jgi:hypothetical protein
MDKRHEDELTKLRDMKAKQDEIEEAYRLQQLEKDQLLADQRYRLMETYLSKSKQTFDWIQQGFNDLYEASGKKIKEFFYVQKAAAIASATISTYQSAIDAYKSTVGIPYVGPYLAPVMAAAAIAAGMGKIATISGTNLAEGGLVPGRSPHPKADNILINATAREFVEPVSSVDYYGLPVMEGIRRKTIPREIFAGMSLPNVGYSRSSSYYAEGGSVAQGPAKEKDTEKGDSKGLTILNFTDPQMLGEYLASDAGNKQLVNVISNNSYVIRNVLFGN